MNQRPPVREMPMMNAEKAMPKTAGSSRTGEGVAAEKLEIHGIEKSCSLCPIKPVAKYETSPKN